MPVSHQKAFPYLMIWTSSLVDQTNGHDIDLYLMNLGELSSLSSLAFQFQNISKSSCSMMLSTEEWSVEIHHLESRARIVYP